MTKVLSGYAFILSLWCACTLFPAAAMAQETSTPYSGFKLGPGDEIHVAVWNDENLSRDLVVRPDGMVSFPLIGELAASGRTVEELRAEVKERITEYVPDSPVTVILTKLESTAVYVVGKVDSPGRFVLGGPTRVMQAIAMAGGLTAYADEESILVLRESGGRMEAIPFDYAELAAGRNLEGDIVLRPGDTIVVP